MSTLQFAAWMLLLTALTLWQRFDRFDFFFHFKIENLPSDKFFFYHHEISYLLQHFISDCVFKLTQ